MELQNITDEQHRLLMKLGFPKECSSEEIPVELAAKWLREKRKLWIETSYSRLSMPPHYVSTVFGYSLRPYRQGFVGRTWYHTDYEGALSEGIDIALKILMDDRKTQPNEHAQYQAVDLGLPSGLKWAAQNVGASSPEDYGDYFMWGSVTPDTDKPCDWEHCPFNNGSSKFDKEYFIANKSEWLTDEGSLKPEYDAVNTIMGDGWRMPTSDEIGELIGCTTRSVEALDGVKGMRFRSKTNGNSIFMPFAGYRSGSYVCIVGNYGYVLSSSLNTAYANDSQHLSFNIDGYALVNNYNRYNGFTARGVHE